PRSSIEISEGYFHRFRRAFGIFLSSFISSRLYFHKAIYCAIKIYIVHTRLQPCFVPHWIMCRYNSHLPITCRRAEVSVPFVLFRAPFSPPTSASSSTVENAPPLPPQEPIAAPQNSRNSLRDNAIYPLPGSEKHIVQRIFS